MSMLTELRNCGTILFDKMKILCGSVSESFYLRKGEFANE